MFDNCYYENSLIYSRINVDLGVTVDDIVLNLARKPNFNNVTKAYIMGNYNEITDKINQKINLYELKPDIIYVMKLRNNNLGMHVDEFKASLNFYMETAGEATKFYGREDKSDSVVLPGNNNPRIEQTGLMEIASFTAKDAELYILNNRVVHSVLSPDLLIKRNRILIKCAWKKLLAEQLLEKIKIF